MDRFMTLLVLTLYSVVHMKNIGARERVPDEPPSAMKYPSSKRYIPSQGSGSVTVLLSSDDNRYRGR